MAFRDFKNQDVILLLILRIIWLGRKILVNIVVDYLDWLPALANMPLSQISYHIDDMGRFSLEFPPLLFVFREIFCCFLGWWDNFHINGHYFLMEVHLKTVARFFVWQLSSMRVSRKRIKTLMGTGIH